MAAPVAPPLCTWLVAACLSAACSAGEEKQRRHRGAGVGVGGLFGSRHRPGSRRRGGARSGEPISRFLLPK